MKFLVQRNDLTVAIGGHEVIDFYVWHQNGWLKAVWNRSWHGFLDWWPELAA